MNYGEKLRYLRTKVRDITLNDLSKKTGLSVSYLSDAELGRSNMSIKALQKVAEALDVSPSYLLDENSISLKEIVDMNKDSLPDDLIDFFTKQKNLPYAVLAKELGEEGIDPEFLKELLESIKKLKSK